MRLENCIKSKNGKIYCWDPDTEQIVEIIKKPIAPADCPDSTILDIMKLLAKKEAFEYA